MELKRVVVTGLGAVTPIGNTVPEFWNNAVNGVSGCAPLTLISEKELAQSKVKFGCEVKNFDITQYIDRKEARKLDRYHHFAIAAGSQAMTDAGFDLEKENLERFGVILGFGMGGLESFAEGCSMLEENKRNGGDFKVSPFFVPKIIGSLASGYLSIIYGFRGPNYTTSSACASSTHSVIDAINLIRLGKCDVMLTGGAEAPMTLAGLTGFSIMHALSTRNDSPETASRPMSASRDGFVLGEGGAVMVLEELEHAKARGAKIYAEVVGWGASADAYHITAPDPEGKGATKVMKDALEDAGMTTADIDYVNMHGTSTPLGDIAECRAIGKVFGDDAYRINISSTKSMTGHLLGGAGAIEAVATVLAVKNDIVPPTINHEDGDNDENIDYNMNFTFNKAQKREIRAGLTNTFGFGGQNSCLIFKKYNG